MCSWSFLTLKRTRYSHIARFRNLRNLGGSSGPGSCARLGRALLCCSCGGCGKGHGYQRKGNYVQARKVTWVPRNASVNISYEYASLHEHQSCRYNARRSLMHKTFYTSVQCVIAPSRVDRSKAAQMSSIWSSLEVITVTSSGPMARGKHLLQRRAPGGGQRVVDQNLMLAPARPARHPHRVFLFSQATSRIRLERR